MESQPLYRDVTISATALNILDTAIKSLLIPILSFYNESIAAMAGTHAHAALTSEIVL
jgi:hypothetical protein